MSSPSSSSDSNDQKDSSNNPIKNSEAEHYDRGNATLRASSILTSGSGLLIWLLTQYHSKSAAIFYGL